MTRYLQLRRDKQGTAVAHTPLHDTPSDMTDVVDLTVEDCTCRRCTVDKADMLLPAPIAEIREKNEGISDEQ